MLSIQIRSETHEGKVSWKHWPPHSKSSLALLHIFTLSYACYSATSFNAESRLKVPQAHRQKNLESHLAYSSFQESSLKILLSAKARTLTCSTNPTLTVMNTAAPQLFWNINKIIKIPCLFNHWWKLKLGSLIKFHHRKEV